VHQSFCPKIFIEERIYKDKEFEQSKDMDAACEHIDERLTPPISAISSFIRAMSSSALSELNFRIRPILISISLNFDTIEAAKVVEANEKLYINREEGFIGTALKKDEVTAKRLI